MKVAIELINPLEASMMLQGNTGNRPIDYKSVARYVGSMLDGTWVAATIATPDAIGITPEGQLLNGQHRLLAVIESGCSIYFKVMREVDPNTFWRAFDEAWAAHEIG